MFRTQLESKVFCLRDLQTIKIPSRNVRKSIEKMSETPDLFRLEGSDGNEAGGLIIRKQTSDHTFKKPSTSQFGLDKLAERKRRENSQEPGSSRSESSKKSKHDSKADRRYRSHGEETPTYTGGVNAEAQKKLESRLKRQRLDAQDARMRRDRERSRSRDRRDRTPRFRDEPQTPKLRARVNIYFSSPECVTRFDNCIGRNC